jgi:hypothetical protein
MLILARADEVDRHRGLVVHIEESPFAPDPDSVRYHALGSLIGAAFALGYRERLRELLRRSPELFVGLVTAARAGDVTLVDGWGDEQWAPRRLLAGALRRVARQVLSPRPAAADDRRLYANATDHLRGGSRA